VKRTFRPATVEIDDLLPDLSGDGVHDDRDFRILADNLPLLCWIARGDGHLQWFNRRWHEFCGTTPEQMRGWGWRSVIHPDHLPRVEQRWRESLTSGKPYETDYPLRHNSGDYRWTLARALPVRDGSGRIVRWIGSCTDIHEEKLAAEHNEILSRELAHRIKNIFAVVSSLISLSARRAPESRDFASTLVDRVMALGRAHEFARPHSDRSRTTMPGTTLKAMIADLLSPYDIGGRTRILLDGEDVDADDQAATPIALVVHELATNAAKYGALTSPDGQVAILVRKLDADIELLWEERGGPLIAGTPTMTGFGTRLAQMAVEQQLGGSIEREWARDGLKLRLQVPHHRLVRQR
jgi:PAS domain S-box-containing protein